MVVRLIKVNSYNLNIKNLLYIGEDFVFKILFVLVLLGRYIAVNVNSLKQKIKNSKLKISKQNLLILVQILILIVSFKLSHLTPCEEFAESIMFLIIKKPIKLCSNIKITNGLRFMKRLAQGTVLTLQQKKDIAQGVELMFITLFSSPIATKDELLRRVWVFYEHPAVSEHILKQSILKGLFPRLTGTKGELMSCREAKNKSNKVFCENVDEKTDIRFFGEVLTTENFADLYDEIEQAYLLSECPTALNKQKTLKFIALDGEKKTSPHQSLHDVEIFGKGFTSKFDIKAGNNMQNTFSNIIGHLWYKQNKAYAITNNIFPLVQLQELRANFLKYYLKNNIEFLNEAQIQAFKNFHVNFHDIRKLNITEIQKNVIIQEELLKLLTYQLPNLKPSFYIISNMDESFKFNAKFEEELLPYIKPDIFDNFENYFIFMKSAIKIYDKQMTNLIKFNIEKSNASFWQGTGFEHITHDVFK